MKNKTSSLCATPRSSSFNDEYWTGLLFQCWKLRPKFITGSFFANRMVFFLLNCGLVCFKFDPVEYWHFPQHIVLICPRSGCCSTWLVYQYFYKFQIHNKTRQKSVNQNLDHGILFLQYKTQGWYLKYTIFNEGLLQSLLKFLYLVFDFFLLLWGGFLWLDNFNK